MKSYIERAIELAKSRRKLAEGSAQPTGDYPVSDHVPAAEPRRRRRVIAPPATNGHPSAVGLLPAIDLANCTSILTDGAVLRQNRVLVGTDSRLPAESAYRMLRTRVMRQMRIGGWRRLGITAAAPGEGKSLTAINLAIAIAAERSQPVVLVDLDLRRPHVHRYLGIAESQFASVGDYLEGRTNSLDQLVFSLAEHGLHCVLGARAIDNSSDLLASPQGQTFLNDLSNRLPGAILIFDLPPLLSTDDPLVAAPTLDALLLVVAEGGAPREDIASAAKLLSEFNLLGVVLNRTLEHIEKGYYNY